MLKRLTSSFLMFLLATSLLLAQDNSKSISHQRITINLGENQKTSGQLIVFPVNNKKQNTDFAGTCVMLCPGGGYSRLVMENEGYDWVEYFHSLGISIAILKYTMPHSNPSIPINDAKDGIKILREKAPIWGLNPQRIGIMGFSAGGHLASMITTTTDSITRPNFSILMYPVITMSENFMHKRSHNEFLGEDASKATELKYSADKRVDENTPPVFLALSNDDRNVNPMNSIKFYEAMLTHNRPCSMHIYPCGRHGWGFRKEFVYHEQMLNELTQWIRHLFDN